MRKQHFLKGPIELYPRGWAGLCGSAQEQQCRASVTQEFLPSRARDAGPGAQEGPAGEPACGQGASSKHVSLFAPTESQNLPKQPPLMLALGQASECLRLMARVGLGSCSFARVDDYLH